MLGTGRKKSTEIDRLDNPIWGRAVDSEQRRMPANSEHKKRKILFKVTNSVSDYKMTIPRSQRWLEKLFREENSRNSLKFERILETSFVFSSQEKQTFGILL